MKAAGHGLELSVLLALLLMWPFGSPAGAASGLHLHGLDQSGWPLLRVFVSVEQRGTLEKSLSRSSFSAVLDDAAPLSVRALRSHVEADIPLAMAVVVDTSGSMKGRPLEIVKQVLSNMVVLKAPGDQLALLSFNDDVFENVAFTPDAAKFRDGAQALQVGGTRTVFYKALFRGVELLENLELPARRQLVIISDGKDEGKGFTLDDGLTKAKQLRIPVHAIGFATKSEQQYLDNMERTAGLTGGQYRRIRRNEDLLEAGEAMIQYIFGQFVLDLTSDQPADGESHRLAVRYTTPEGMVQSDSWEFTAPIASEKSGAAPKDPTGQSSSTHAEQTSVPSADRPSTQDPSVTTRFTDLKGIIFAAIAGLTLLVAGVLFLVQRKRATRSDLSSVAQGESEHAQDSSSCPQCGQAQRPQWKECPFCRDDLLSGGQGAEPLEGKKTDNSLINTRLWEAGMTSNGPQWRLVVPDMGIELSLRSGAMTIGANPGNAMMLDEETVSGFHAEISGYGQEWFLKDLGSLNGTSINGEPITGPVQLVPGDRLKLGRIEAIIETHEED